ncbi:MAG: hypothetical protein GXP53_03510 [Deltaproteobacteria bacterium]|nr:hypothetical protein [Deltaproteobacteria bacterium]
MKLPAPHKDWRSLFLRAPYRTGSSSQKQKIKAPEIKKEHLPDKDDENLVCRQCGCVITSSLEQIAVKGSGSHTFANPVGIVFEITCFKNAPGCGISGQASGEFTWFSGYAWQVAFCMSCLTHMGWRFISNSGRTFFALITDKLVGRD